jgi:acyl carrier protein
MYRTGDLARWRDNGIIEFIGRRDRQVKIRGFRVEPGEIEAALASHPAVREAAVVVQTGTDGARRLIGYVTGMDVGGDGAALKGFLQARLPDYMVPFTIVLLEAMPLTANGKVDRAALPEPVQGRADGQVLPPRTPEEKTLARIWSEVLGVPTVGLSDHFFELGGHSLLATQVIARLRHEIGVDVPLRTLFTAPTLETLAAEVERLRAAGTGTTRTHAIEAIPRSTVRSKRSAPDKPGSGG